MNTFISKVQSQPLTLGLPVSCLSISLLSYCCLFHTLADESRVELRKVS